MPRRSSAPIASARSGAVKSFSRARSRRDVVQPPDQHVGQHIQSQHKIELLEDHRGIGAPAVQPSAAELGDVAAVEYHATGGRLDQPVHHPQQR